ncbi:hypothetical protein IAI10_00705 [Clostridium sp. 19966]|uniref:hypothetical protein n=1 Tax=Clostridium sp. 19966 TaxID=2768166 RepID=UPI0028DE0570|nr:hypothetical protein [Clostridium sp. 19966]MDT8715201.1 hypothetical protein [Clostridium sp. 19966]
MQSKNFEIHHSKINTVIYILKKLLPFILLLIIFSAAIIFINSAYKDGNSRRLYAADFRFDVSMLTETANVIEMERKSNSSSDINAFGSDGKAIKKAALTLDLKTALIKIGDTDFDNKLSDEEFDSLGMAGLDNAVFKKEFNTLKFNTICEDRNLKNYVVITKGSHAGTILYNGALKFIDDDGRQYLGLELSI